MKTEPDIGYLYYHSPPLHIVAGSNDPLPHGGYYVASDEGYNQCHYLHLDGKWYTSTRNDRGERGGFFPDKATVKTVAN